uniref:rRNA intron-encoded endonuclease n=1 Tax=Thermoproteus sp. IC-061 TaxID=70773 RepID=Q6L6Z6_9CREN|nr:rRNA intron-encoded endonuclease [Thermoproteus sp. IC-061]
MTEIRMTCEEFADYLVGVVAGDGDLYHDARRGYRVRIADASIHYLNMLNDYLRRCLKAEGRIYKHKKYKAHYLVIWRKEVYDLITRRIQDLLERPTPAFVAGLIDAEGGIGKTRHGLYRLYFTNIDKKIVDIVARMLESYGIKYYLVAEGRKYRVYVHGIDRIREVLDKPPVIHPKIRDKFLSFFTKINFLYRPSLRGEGDSPVGETARGGVPGSRSTSPWFWRGKLAATGRQG